MELERIPASTLRAALAAAGCQVSTERGAWWRCLIEEPGASWVGEASTEEGAVAAAFARMVPSARVRSWLLAGADAAAAADPSPAPPPARPPEPEPEPEPELEPKPEFVPELVPEAEQVPLPVPELRTKREIHPAPAPVSVPAPIPLEEALAMLAQQSDDIRVASRELGELAPSRLRLLMLH